MINGFRFLELEKWACIFCDTCIRVANVSNRFKFETFFISILSFENGISNE